MDGRCKTLDASADGYVRAETCIVLLLQATTATDAAETSGSPSTAIFMKGTFVNQVSQSTHCIASLRPHPDHLTPSRNVDLYSFIISVARWLCHTGWPLEQPHSAKWALAAERHPGCSGRG